MPAYKMVVMSNALDGRDDEFNAWYDTQHINDVLNVPGFYRAQRLTPVNPLSDAPPPFKYMTIYEFETDDLKRTFDYFLSITGTDKMPMTDAMDRNAAMHIVEATGLPVERSVPTPWPAS